MNRVLIPMINEAFFCLMEVSHQHEMTSLILTLHCIMLSQQSHGKHAPPHSWGTPCMPNTGPPFSIKSSFTPTLPL